MSEDFKEGAKAVQELAKLGQGALSTGAKLGGFLARVLEEPIDAVAGILTDKLNFIRSEYLARFQEQAEAAQARRGLHAQIRAVPLKLALPIFENASIEPDEELREIWANLIASAMDLTFEDAGRAAFIDIAKQLEVIDARLLGVAFAVYRAAKRGKGDPNEWFSPSKIPIESIGLRSAIGLTEKKYEAAADNLFRLRCMASYVQTTDFDSVTNGSLELSSASVYHVYDKLCFTSLGLAFVEACLPIVGLSEATPDRG